MLCSKGGMLKLYEEVSCVEGKWLILGYLLWNVELPGELLQQPPQETPFSPTIQGKKIGQSSLRTLIAIQFVEYILQLNSE